MQIFIQVCEFKGVERGGFCFMKKLFKEEDIFIVGEVVFVSICCSVGFDIIVRYIVFSKCVQVGGKLGKSEDNGFKIYYQNFNIYEIIRSKLGES